MGFLREIKIAKVGGVAQDVEGAELSSSQAMVVYIRPQLGFEEKFTYNPVIQFYRKVTVDGTCNEIECVFFDESCDRIYLPAGQYTATACPLTNKYYDGIDDVEINVDLIVETLTKEYKEVVMMNEGCC